MSDPTTTAVPKSEDKPTEVTPAVEPSPETKVETPAPVPDAPKEDIKAEEPTNAETPPVTNHTAEPSAASEPKEEDKPAEVSPKDDRPRSPNFFARLLKIGKSATKARGGDKKKEKAPASPEEPVVPAEAKEPSPTDPKPEEKPVVETTEEAPAPADPVKDSEPAPAPAEIEATTDKEPKNGDGKKEETKTVGLPTKIGRRLSARVSGIFASSTTKRKDGTGVPPKVDEAPPKIEEHSPVAPLENPAADSTPANVQEPQKDEIKETNEPPKIIDATPAPVVATA